MALDITAKIPIIRVVSDSVEKEQQKKLNLPQPSFRKIPKQDYMRRKHTATKYYKDKSKEGISKDCYFHYKEPTQEELNNTVEYDMDLEDINWLEQFNEQNGGTLRVTDSDFEKIMDRLEKESYFESVKSGQGSRHDVDEDAVCAVCDIGDCHNTNVIIFCDMCDLAVHQECYGVPNTPLGKWLCKRCQLSPTQHVECCLCPNPGGALKLTEPTKYVMAGGNTRIMGHKTGWAHVVCAKWFPELNYGRPFAEIIRGIDDINANKWRLKCFICKQRHKGACIQCKRRNCCRAFHVTCAKQAGLSMRMQTICYESGGATISDVKRVAYCDKHTPPGKKTFRNRNIRRAREELAKQLVEYQKEAALVKVNDDKLLDIAKDLRLRGIEKMCVSNSLDKIRLEYVQRIHAYWLQKRQSRNGVPLLRRLQVNQEQSHQIDLRLDFSDKEKHEVWRYDIERARILLEEIRRREKLKLRALRMGIEIIKCKFDIIDKEDPADEE
uniref:Peregrin n=1 Tax=Aceria tosichella TaxID=561515 RepID=A0A6G1SN38_9ACAR